MILPQDIESLIKIFGVIIAAAALVANAYFSWKRLRHDNASRSISASSALIREWRDKEFQAAIDFVVHKFKMEYIDAQSTGYRNIKDASHKAMVVKVSHLCDEIGSRTISGEADEVFIITFLGKAISDLAYILEPYIEAERVFRGEDQLKNKTQNHPCDEHQKKQIYDEYQGDFLLLAKKSRQVDLSEIIKKRHKKFMISGLPLRRKIIVWFAWKNK